MTVPPDLLRAFIDGKLTAEDAGGVAARIADDPELAAYVEDQKAVKAMFESPPARWLARSRDRIVAQAANWIPVTIMASGIVLGILLAGVFGIGTDFRSQSGTLVAQGDLAQVLNSALFDEDSAGPVRIGPSFWSKNAVFCRSFVTKGNAQGGAAGIACRDRGAWRIAILTAMSPDEIPEARLPAAALPASVRGVMDNLIVGEPLGADAERQARDQGWRAQ